MNDFITVNNKNIKNNKKANNKQNNYLVNSSAPSSSDEEKRLRAPKVKILIEGQTGLQQTLAFDISTKYQNEYYAENTEFEGPDGKVLSAPVFFF